MLVLCMNESGAMRCEGLVAFSGYLGYPNTSRSSCKDHPRRGSLADLHKAGTEHVQAAGGFVVVSLYQRASSEMVRWGDLLQTSAVWTPIHFLRPSLKKKKIRSMKHIFYYKYLL